MNKLKINSLSNFLRTLKYFASKKEQERYKAAVPFVHIPIEILEQLSNHARMLRECSWFSVLFTNEEVEKITKFDKYCFDETEIYDDDFPDVPEIFEEENWQTIVSKASSLFEEFQPIIETKIKELK